MSIISDNYVLSLLKDCGFSEKERILISTLLSLGPRSPSILARHSGLKRPTVYYLLEQLEERGIVKRITKEQTVLYSLVPPNMLPNIIERNAELQFKQVQGSVSKLRKELSKKSAPSMVDIGGLVVRTIDTEQSLLFELETVLSKGNFLGIFNPQVTIQGRAKKMVHRFLASTAETEASIREIIVKGPKAQWYKTQIKNPNHLVKEIPAIRTIKTDIVLAEGKVFLAHYNMKDQNAVCIENTDLYQSWVAVFEELWEKL